MKMNYFAEDGLGFEPKDRYYFMEQAIAKELDVLNQRMRAVERSYEEAKVLLTAAKIEAKLQQKTIDLISERLDKVIGAIVTAREEEENEK